MIQTSETMANALWSAYDKGAIEPLRNSASDLSVHAAYAVQDINTERKLAAGSRLVGRKIGLTSKAVQTQLGVDQPDYGMLFSDSVYCSGDNLSLSNFLQPKVEAEIAFVLKHDLHSKDLTIIDVVNSIDYVVAALEIVDSRIANWDISLFDTIADNASYGAFVMGTQARRLADVDLENCTMQLFDNGRPVSEGMGKACLGNPLNATLWLAKMMVQAGRPLSAGDAVLSGALGPMQAVSGAGEFRAEISGLGTVSISLTEA